MAPPDSQNSVFEETKALAELGVALAQWNLAQLYLGGSGVPESYAEAVRWFGLAANQGHLDAQLDLAFMYVEGSRVPQNYSEAARLFRMAAKQGNSAAQTELPSMYEDGTGMPQNLTMAYVWASLTAAQGGSVGEMAKANRDSIAARLTPEQFATGQEIATRCFESNFDDCN